jgi:anti-sigma factor RsiW
MKHFSTEIWAYFARGALLADETIQMQRHLEDCEKCRQTHDMWRAVLEIGLREKDYHPRKTIIPTTAWFVVRRRRTVCIRRGNVLEGRRELD